MSQMRWEKLGIVLAPDPSLAWQQTHAMVPTPIVLEGGVIRVYFTSCDAQMVGRVGYCDLSAGDPTQVLSRTSEPVLDIGADGCFDESGVVVCSVVADGAQHYMYYAGYELGQKVRYRLLTGVAVSDDGGDRFRRLSQVPVLDRREGERFFRGGPFAHLHSGELRLIYVSGNEWTQVAGKALPNYELRELRSESHASWGGDPRRLLALSGEDEHGFGRPWMVRNSANDFELFYSVRRTSLAAYRMGYARSRDGLNWVRDDQAMGLDVSPGGFDSVAIMYAAVIDVAAERYCFYNGNDFGKAGFAVARLVR